MRTCVIINPNAGSADEIADIRRRLGELAGCMSFITESPGDGERLAREAVEQGYDQIVAAGGDGTVNEVLNGMAHAADRVRFGIFPLGTGNDFARALGMPLDDVPAAIDVLARGFTRRVDLARVESPHQRFFLNTAGGGFTAKVGEKIDSGAKGLWGSLAYFWAAAKTFPEMDPHRIRLLVDDQLIEADAYAVIVGNGTTIGGGLPLCPGAQIDDGLLDVLVIPAVPVGRLAAMIPRMLAGAHDDVEEVLCEQGTRIEVACDPPMPFNLDGEPFGDTPVRISLAPGGLTVVAPEPGATSS